MFDTSSTYEKRVQVIKRLVQKGINSDDCIGYHGTSIEAFKYYLEHGNMAGYSGQQFTKPELSQIGDLYFYPFDRTIVDKTTADERDFQTKKQSLKSGMDIAEEVGRAHYVLSQLRIPLVSKYEYSYLDYLINVPLWLPFGLPFWNSLFWKEPDTKCPDYADYHKVVDLLPKKKLQKIIKQSRPVKGVVVAINRQVITHDSMRFGDDTHDMRIDIRETPLEYAFSGIKLMGKYEKDFFNSL